MSALPGRFAEGPGVMLSSQHRFHSPCRQSWREHRIVLVNPVATGLLHPFLRWQQDCPGALQASEPCRAQGWDSSQEKNVEVVCEKNLVVLWGDNSEKSILVTAVMGFLGKMPKSEIRPR